MRSVLVPIAVAFLLSLTAQAECAEVGCDTVFDGHPREEFAKEAWPSGFRPTSGMCYSGFIRGIISKGDYDKVRELYARNHPLLGTFYLVSPGGDLSEALKIGAFFRKYLIAARAPMRWTTGDFDLFLAERVKCDSTACACASACALIWLGASSRFGTVGLHRPRTEDTSFKKMSPADATKVYRRIIDDIRRYLDDMEAPQIVANAILTTSSADIQWIDDSENGLHRPPSIAEWLDASCGQFSREEKNTQIELEAKRQRLSSNDALLLKMLNEKSARKTSCELRLISRSRDELPRP